MCRLIGFASLASESIGDVIGEQQCDMFQDMSRLHRDGWGTMWLDDERTPGSPTVAAVRSVASGLSDVDLRSSLISQPSRARVAHLRLASKGMPIRPENTHPYLAGNLGFAHNGGIIPTAALRSLLTEKYLAEVQGDTDSELYFALIRQNLRRGGSLSSATVDAVAEIRSRYPSASLNALLLSADQLIAVHASRHTPIPHEEFADSGLPHHELPLEHATDYYRMGYYRSANGSIAFSSVGIDMAGWHELPQESVTTVDLRTLQLEVIALESAESLTA
ncbi:class II glutamine amidotransferase [Lysobacter korlensis]|uniref:Class II glutamine amidotransferase n=1 Tax=Lysobacter korlensis TaxID=553636 RepID=A0ABV6RNF4_9GAMM